MELSNFTSGLKSFITGTQGQSINDSWFDTPYGGNTIAEPTLTKAQKTFASQDITPNLPKPKSLYFVFFHLNPHLSERVTYKKKFMEMLGNNGGLDVGAYTTSEKKKVEGEILDAIKNELDKGPVQPSKISSLLKSPVSGLTGNNKEKSTDESILDYIPEPDLFYKLSYEMSKMVRSYDKPGISSLDATEFNEYNRKRYVYTGIKYKDVKISFYDVKESPVQQFFIAYLKFINGDSFCKDANIWEKPIDNCHWQNAKGYKSVNINDKGTNINGTYYGNLNSFGLNIDSNFRLIDRISFCEYYMNKMTVYTIENPVVTAIDFGSGEMGNFESNTITVTFKYEGITNDLVDIKQSAGYTDPANQSWWAKALKSISGGDKSVKLDLKCMVNHSIKSDVANFMQTRYSTWSGKLVSDIASTLKAYMNGDVKFSWNTLKNQALDTMRKYNMAGAANTIAQAEQTIKNYRSKDGKDQAKYLISMATDPTSLIGKATTGNAAGRGSTSGWFF